MYLVLHTLRISLLCGSVQRPNAYRRFVINSKGRKVINAIDFEIGHQMAMEIQVVDHNSRRYWLFTELLCGLVGFLPDADVTQTDFDSGVQFYELVTQEEANDRKLLTDEAFELSRSMRSQGKSILSLVNLLMVPKIDPKGWDDFVRGRSTEDAPPPE